MGLLDGKVAIITGAASGIGAAAAREFAAEGAFVLLADIDVDAGEAVAQSVRGHGGQALFLRTDVTRDSDVEAAVQAAVAEWGRLDLAFNNAGIDGVACDLDQHTEQDWGQVIDVNLHGVARCMRYEVRQMRSQGGGGAIVNTSSAVGLMGVDVGIAPYVASKHAVVGLTKAAALEFAARGIRVNALCPGGVATPLVEHTQQQGAGSEEAARDMIPMRRLGTPQEIAAVAAFLCSDKASYITGSTVAVDGGMSAGYPRPLRVAVPGSVG